MWVAQTCFSRSAIGALLNISRKRLPCILALLNFGQNRKQTAVGYREADRERGILNETIVTNAPMADLEKHVCATHMLSFIR